MQSNESIQVTWLDFVRRGVKSNIFVSELKVLKIFASLTFHDTFSKQGIKRRKGSNQRLLRR